MKKSIILICMLVAVCSLLFCACSDSKIPGGTGSLIVPTPTDSISMDTTPTETQTDESTAPTETQTDETTAPTETQTDETTAPTTDHEHSYSNTVTLAATCSAEGVRTYTCSGCSHSYTEAIAKTAHNYAAATCTKPQTCKACNATTGTALGHNYVYTKNVAPTTSATGSLRGTCSRCSDAVSVNLPKLTSTDYSRTTTKAATCTTDGTYTWTWKTTSYGTFSYTSNIAATGHSGEWYNILRATPVSTGTDQRICTACGQTETKTLSKVTSYVGSYYYNSTCTNIPSNLKNDAGYTLHCVWWQDGYLYASIYMFNDTTNAITLPSSFNIVLTDSNGNVIADGIFNFGHVTLDAKSGQYHRLNFTSDCINGSLYGSNLSAGVFVKLS